MTAREIKVEDLVIALINTQENSAFTLSEREGLCDDAVSLYANVNDDVPYAISIHNTNVITYYAVGVFCDGVNTKNTADVLSDTNPSLNDLYSVYPDRTVRVLGFDDGSEFVREFLVSGELRRSKAKEHGFEGRMGYIDIVVYQIDVDFTPEEAQQLKALYKKYNDCDDDNDEKKPFVGLMCVTTEGRRMKVTKEKATQNLLTAYERICISAISEARFTLEFKKKLEIKLRQE